jgi:hypothetical protein
VSAVMGHESWGPGDEHADCQSHDRYPLTHHRSPITDYRLLMTDYR